MMKGLQGERLRQALKYLDADQDGFIRPDEFKRIILVCDLTWNSRTRISNIFLYLSRKLLDTNYPRASLNVFPPFVPFLQVVGYLILRSLRSLMSSEVGKFCNMFC